MWALYIQKRYKEFGAQAKIEIFSGKDL